MVNIDNQYCRLCGKMFDDDKIYCERCEKKLDKMKEQDDKRKLRDRNN